MAGLYPDVPGHRFAYDLDGTYVSVDPQNGGAFSAVDAGLMNDESSDEFVMISYDQRAAITRQLAFAFPEPRDISGIFVMSIYTPSTMRLDTSTDTTDGSNGTWTAGPNVMTARFNRFYPESRSAIFPVSLLGIKGLRLVASVTSATFLGLHLQGLHLYGFTSPTQSPERLEWWDPTLDQQVAKAALDFGDTAQGTMSTKTLRLRNLSATKVANSVAITANNAAGGETLLASGITFSLDNVTYSASVTLPTLAALTTSPLIYVRRTVGAADASSIRFARIVATPGTYA